VKTKNGRQPAGALRFRGRLPAADLKVDDYV
jgi:hypothetical protein